MNIAKKILMSLLIIAMVITGLCFNPVTANAEETVAEAENGVIYVLDETNYNFRDYWSENEAERTAPIREGYVFGGWYKKTEENTYKPIREVFMSSYNGVAYAKFVPAYVLSVRAQIEKATQDNNGNTTKTFLRVISAVDSTSYQETGFDIWYNNRIQEDEAGTVLTTVYTSLVNDEGTIYPNTIFGDAASHFSVLKINKIGKVNYNKLIYTRPYWVTMDGTKVEGLAKYVHVEDGYASNQYISVPVNILTGQDVAAGLMEMKYDQNRLNFVGFEAGRMFDEMDHNVDKENGVVSFIGDMSTENIDVHTKAEGIYANVRFRLKDNADIANMLEFTMNGESFCDWNQNFVNNVFAWNSRHLFQQ